MANKIIRLTESELTKLVKKVIEEQNRNNDPSDQYFMAIDYIANYAMDESMESEDIEAAIDEISDIMHASNSDDELSDDELDEIISYGGQVIMELENMFDSEESEFEENETLYEDEYGSVQSINYETEFINEAEYQGRKVQLGKVMQGDVKKSKVYVKNDKGKVVKVNFGFGGKSAKGKRMSIKKNNPERRKSFRARHNCENPGPRWKPKYWSCKAW
jgi:aspartokinase